MSISHYTDGEHLNAFRSCSRESMVAFAGSGCSYLPGIPTWNNFLYELKSTVGAMIDLEPFLAANQFYEAASAIYNEIDNPSDFYAGIDAVINEKSQTDYIALHHSIWSSFDRVLTTNYDHLFEYAFKAYNRPLLDKGVGGFSFQKQELPELNFEEFSTTEKSLAYLHGRAGSKHIVLRLEDYQKYYPSFYPGQCADPSANLEDFLEKAVGKFSFAFIGYSLDDRDFVRAFEAFIENYKERTKNSPVAGSQMDHRGHFIFILNNDLKHWLNPQDVINAGLSIDRLIETRVLKYALHDPEQMIFASNLNRVIANAGLTLDERAKILELKEKLERNGRKLELLQKLNIRDIRITGNDFNAISRFLIETRQVQDASEQIDIDSI